ncbi:MAG: hypothetical protein WCS86_02255 [Candidatus Paceibacterota bacterium]
MKNSLLFLMVVVLLGTTTCSAQFLLNRNPQDPSKVPDWENEIGIVLSHDSPTITIKGEGGREYTNHLVAGVLVICDRETHIAKWVAVCGNDVVTANWRPEGKEISFEDENNYKSACEDMLSRLKSLQEGMDELLRRPTSYNLAELKLMLFEGVKSSPPAPPTFSEEKSWTTTKTFTTILGAGLGTVAGGYLFQTTTTNVVVVPGVSLQSGDGTIVFGPNKVNVTEEKKFNVVAAIGCGAASGLITYLLNVALF